MANFPQGIVYDNQIGKTAKVSPMREIAAGDPTRLAGCAFSGAVKDTNFWAQVDVNAGPTVTQGNGAILMATGATAAGAGTQYVSIRTARYTAGVANFFRAVVRVLDTGVAGNARRWGAFTVGGAGGVVPQDGAYFELSGTTLNAVVCKGGAPTAKASNLWDVAFTLDTNAHTYEIWYTSSKVWFYIDDVLRYTHNAATTTWSATRTLTVGLQDLNTLITQDVQMEVRVASIYSFCHIRSECIYKYVTAGTNVCKNGPGRLHRIVINSAAGTSLSVYDNPTGAGTVIAVLDTSAPACIEFDCPFFTGLTVIASGTVACTVIYE